MADACSGVFQTVEDDSALLSQSSITLQWAPITPCPSEQPLHGNLGVVDSSWLGPEKQVQT